MSAPGLEALLALQDLDSALDRMRHRLDHLPEQAELTDLVSTQASLLARRAATTTVRAEVAAREQALEDELRTTEERAAAVEHRLYGGEVTASRELQAMAADAAALRARASALEDRAIEALEEREPLDAELAVADAEVEALEAARIAVSARVGIAHQAVAGEVGALIEQRALAAAAVAPELLGHYERLRSRLGGVGVARLVGSRCDGCHLTVPAGELDHLRHQPPEAEVHCEQCGRILVRP